MATLNLKFSECGYGGRRNSVNSKNEVFEYLIDQLRQQLPVADVMCEIKRWSIDRSIAGRGSYTDEENAIIDAYIGLEHRPYKQQCEDLAHEVLSLKNQLRDASALVAELQKELQHQIDLANGIFRGSTVSFDEKGKVTGIEHWIKSEQSGCRKEDTHGKGAGVVGCGREGGVKVTGAKGECPHLWHYYDDHLVHCALCGLKRSDEDL